MSTQNRTLVQPPATSTADIIRLLLSSQRFTAGEDISVLDHGLQTADILRRAFPDDLELQVAGLVHDIDHVIGCHPSRHGVTASDYLGDVLPFSLTELVRLHPIAKRFLINLDPAYADRLSVASIASLQFQGNGPDSDEIDLFIADPQHRRVIALRRADDQAKIPGLRVPTLASWIPVILEVAAADRSTGRW